MKIKKNNHSIKGLVLRGVVVELTVKDSHNKDTVMASEVLPKDREELKDFLEKQLDEYLNKYFDTNRN